MGTRHKARILAFQIIYSWDFEKGDIKSLYESDIQLCKNNFSESSEVFVRFLVFGTIENIAAIDKCISENTKNWDFDRLAKVDLAILRISIYGLLFQKDIPGNVVIDEAVDIAKEFGSDESYKFVNGVLDSVYKKLKNSDVSDK